MISTLIEPYHSKDLLWTWTSRIIRARYQQTVLGGLWIIVQPTANVAIFTIIFTIFIPIDTGNVPYVLFSYIALTPWLLFSNALSDMSASVVENMQLITKIYFPREVLSLASLLARLLDFFVSLCLLVIMLIYYNIQIFPKGWLFLPLIFMIQMMLMMGLGLILAALNVFYRDVKPLLNLGIQLWFYASPIIYPISVIPERFRSIYFLNPMAGILKAFRDVILEKSIPDSSLLLSALIAFTTLIIGYWYFKKAEYQFADII